MIRFTGAALLLLAALCAAPAAHGQAAAQRRGTSLAFHLDRALQIDAAYQALAARREAVAARGIAARSPIAGSPALGGAMRGDLRGPREARELDLEIAAPLWLPGQRGALAGTIAADLAQVEARLAQRRLEVAGVLRDAWWLSAAAAQEVRLARDRLATARDIARDVARRAELGDIPPGDALLERGETLAAELALAQAEAELAASRAAYRTLSGGLDPDLPPEPPVARNPDHPALRAARTGVAAAEAQVRLVAATPRDNPELGFFGRNEEGRLTEQGVSLGLRFRLPLATEARNAPRRAEAQAELTRASAELSQRQRLVEAEIGLARQALEAADAAARLARQRLGVADQQLDLARRAFRAGETGLFDLFRVRQLRLEAAAAEGRARVALGRARSRLNQALGVLPKG